MLCIRMIFKLKHLLVENVLIFVKTCTIDSKKINVIGIAHIKSYLFNALELSTVFRDVKITRPEKRKENGFVT